MDNESRLKKIKIEGEKIKTELTIKQSEEKKLSADCKAKYGITSNTQITTRLHAIDKELAKLEAKEDELLTQAEERIAKYDAED